MSRKKEFIKNTIIISIGTFFPKFVSILLTPILTARLTDIEFGRYDLITTIAALLLPAITLQISSAAFRFLIDNRNSHEECERIISTILAFTVMISLATCSVFYIVYGYKLDYLGICISCYLFVNIILITTQQIVRGLGFNVLYSISAMIFSVCDTLLVAILLGFFGNVNYGLFGVLIAMNLATLIATIFLIYKSKIYKYIRFSSISRGKLVDMLKYSWPMVPNNMSDWVLRLSDRLVITGFLGVQANAIYAVANKMPTIFSAFQTTFSLAWQENASIALKDKDSSDYYSQMCNWIFSLLFGVMALLIAITPVLWRLLIRGNYQAAYPQLPILYMGILFSCMSATIGGIYIAHMKTKSAGISTMMAACLNLLIDLLLINRIGIWAGSISTMISYLCLLVFRMVGAKSFAKIKFDLKSIILGVAIIFLMGMLCYLDSFITIALNYFIAIIVLIVFDRSIITSFFQRISEFCRNKHV